MCWSVLTNFPVSECFYYRGNTFLRLVGPRQARKLKVGNQGGATTDETRRAAGGDAETRGDLRQGPLLRGSPDIVFRLIEAELLGALGGAQLEEPARLRGLDL